MKLPKMCSARCPASDCSRVNCTRYLYSLLLFSTLCRHLNLLYTPHAVHCKFMGMWSTSHLKLHNHSNLGRQYVTQTRSSFYVAQSQPCGQRHTWCCAIADSPLSYATRSLRCVAQSHRRVAQSLKYRVAQPRSAMLCWTNTTMWSTSHLNLRNH